ncbi:MAG: hypothetical protein IKY45_00325 [Clostridia bacterium]|nr:hypothetical protein [Clostridia bacterium]MBR4972891.1 hypothetical protein [Clostridia bacterium]
MDDLSEKLAGILNDPESMERVRKMAENILGDNGEAPKPASPLDDLGSVLGAADIQSIISIISKLKNSGNDPRSQLLNALKPHLSEPRREKVDTAIKILKMLELLPLMKESGILKL